MNILGHWQQVGPVILLEIAIDTQVLFQPLICPFRLTVCLRMIRHADVLVDVQYSTELLCEFWGESGVSV